jgi:uncharacterized SAM-binding protein YcdF (DUF218 family)
VKQGSGGGLRRLGGGIARIAAVAMLVIVVFCATSFARFVWEITSVSNPAQIVQADGIIVLTGDKSRIETALQLLEDGKGSRLLISGVNQDTSADAIRNAVSGNDALFDCCIDIDKAALDTVGNAEQAAIWARENGFGSLIVVTSDYHMPRSLMELRRKARDVALQPYLVRTEASLASSPLADPEALRRILPEFAKYLAARIRLGIRERQTRTALAAAMTI